MLPIDDSTREPYRPCRVYHTPSQSDGWHFNLQKGMHTATSGWLLLVNVATSLAPFALVIGTFSMCSASRLLLSIQAPSMSCSTWSKLISASCWPCKIITLCFDWWITHLWPLRVVWETWSSQSQVYDTYMLSLGSCSGLLGQTIQQACSAAWIRDSYIGSEVDWWLPAWAPFDMWKWSSSVFRGSLMLSRLWLSSELSHWPVQQVSWDSNSATTEWCCKAIDCQSHWKDM